MLSFLVLGVLLGLMQFFAWRSLSATGFVRSVVRPVTAGLLVTAAVLALGALTSRIASEEFRSSPMMWLGFLFLSGLLYVGLVLAVMAPLRQSHYRARRNASPVDRKSERMPAIDRRRFVLATSGVAAVGGVAAWNALGVNRSEVLAEPDEEDFALADIVVISADVNNEGTPAANSAAIAAAISSAEAEKGSVRIPAGVYRHEGFSAAAGVTIFGDGIGRTVLLNAHATNDSVVIAGAGDGDYIPGVQLRDMTLSATSMRPGQTGIKALLARSVVVSQVEITNHGIGVQHRTSWAQLYSSVRVVSCEIGWHIPAPDPFPPSTPVTMTACHAIECGTGLQVDDGIESLVWSGGDLSGCGTGIVLNGNQTRQLTFNGVNFEAISLVDVEIGSIGAPTAVTFVGCRFFRKTKTGSRSIRFIAGAGLTFVGCRWTGFELAVQQTTSTGTLLLLGCSAHDTDGFLELDARAYAPAALVVSQQSTGVHVWPVNSGTEELEFGVIPPQEFSDVPMTVDGALLGDCVSLGIPPAAASAGLTFAGWVSSPGTVTVRAFNSTAEIVDIGAGSFKAAIIR